MDEGSVWQRSWVGEGTSWTKGPALGPRAPFALPVPRERHLLGLFEWKETGFDFPEEGT